MTAHQGKCFCGAVEIEVQGNPEAMGYCHCSSCRSWSASPVNAFTLWQPQHKSHEGRRASWPLQENRYERPAILRAVRRSSNDRPSTPRSGRRLCGDDPDAEIQPRRSRQLFRDGTADEGRPAEAEGLSRRTRRIGRCRSRIVAISPPTKPTKRKETWI